MTLLPIRQSLIHQIGVDGVRLLSYLVTYRHHVVYAGEMWSSVICDMSERLSIILISGVCLLPTLHVNGQQHIHLAGTMPTVDLGVSLGEGWYLENYSFASILPFEQTRPSFSQVQTMQDYGPGAELGEFRSVRALVFAYTEFDLTRTLSETWSITGSYTHEWVPMTSAAIWTPQRYTRDEHRVWLQAKRMQQGERLLWWLRTRWDQRMIENDPFHQDQDDWSWRPRVRQQFGAHWPLGTGFLTASAEVFIEAWDGANVTQGGDRFRESWTSLQFSRQLNDGVKWEVGPLLVSWKQLDANGSLGWAHYWYLQTTAFINLTRS